MTTTHATVTVTAATAVALADDLNARFAAGELTTVNGYEVTAGYSKTIARSWQNGTVSVRVKGRTPRAVKDLYLKVGQTLRTA